MTLIITAIAALAATIVRFAAPQAAERFHVGALALMCWGASVMWCVDGFASMAEGESFIEVADTAAMADDALLGVCVVVLAIIAWGIVNLIKRRKPATTAA